MSIISNVSYIRERLQENMCSLRTTYQNGFYVVDSVNSHHMFGVYLEEINGNPLAKKKGSCTIPID